jgi:vacuolar-type H+-ATPase subunit I/STV1
MKKLFKKIFGNKKQAPSDIVSAKTDVSILANRRREVEEEKIEIEPLEDFNNISTQNKSLQEIEDEELARTLQAEEDSRAFEVYESDKKSKTFVKKLQKEEKYKYYNPSQDSENVRDILEQRKNRTNSSIADMLESQMYI